MNGLSSFTKMMQRPAPITTASSVQQTTNSTSPKLGAPPPPPEGGGSTSAAMAAATSVAIDEMGQVGVVSPISTAPALPPTSQEQAAAPPGAGTVSGLTLSSYAKAVRDGTGGAASTQRPPLVAGGVGGGPMRPAGLGSVDPMARPAPPTKQVQYDFRYDDTDNLMNELQEFFPYAEMPHLAENEAAFREDFGEDWTQTNIKRRRQYVEVQLELLEHKSLSHRVAASKRLFYLLQGNFAYTNSPEHQLHWVIENARLVRAANGVASTLNALKLASTRHDRYAAGHEPSRQMFSPGFGEGQQNLPGHQQSDGSQHHSAEEVNSEIGTYLGILYFVVEVFRSSDDSFGDELMALDPPLPVYLLSTVASLREKTAKGYPVKKLLLLVWKTLLACLGGLREVKSTMALQRELAGLSASKTDFTKVTPVGIDSFRKDTSIKYPTFEISNPPENTPVPASKLAEAIQPMPIRANYHTMIEDEQSGIYVSRAPVQPKNGTQPGPPQPGTPAPSPPQTPLMKPKKQQYQTDPTRPFVFPFSRQDDGPARLVPFAIDEADRLYNKHMHVPLGLYQLWQTRSEYIREESGLGVSGLIGFSSAYDDDDDLEPEDTAWTDYQMADWRFQEEEERCAQTKNHSGVSAAKRSRNNLKRLYWIEVIYRSILPASQSIVVVLLKLLLATVTTTPAANPAQNGSPTGLDHPGGFAKEPTTENPDLPPPTMEEVDVLRHREITSKAVSAIILLLLKWFKASHVLKFQHLSTLLIDSNCLLLILKMFGFQELMATVQAKNDWEDANFFRYCMLHFSPDKGTRPEDEMLSQPKGPATRTLAGGEEIELISEYSWRNFFFAINFVRIMHQLTKQRPVRITLLVQYKSTQILKRMLRVPHPMLQLQILKVIKSQVPFCGRKWRQSNMKTITAVYLNCKPELRDDWLAATDIDADVEESSNAEAALRALVRFYHTHHYGKYITGLSQEAMHRRSNSLATGGPDEMMPQPGSSLHRSDSDVFPPNRTLLRRSSKSSLDGSSGDLDDMIGVWLYEYEELLGDILGEDASVGAAWDGSEGLRSPRPSVLISSRNDPAWNRLDAIMRGRSSEEDVISDSESVVSIGELGSDARFGNDLDESAGFDQGDMSQNQNENTWAHLSHHALGLLPKSPNEKGRRRSSSGSGGSPLRPVIGSSDDWLGNVVEDDDDEELGPMPIEEGTQDERQRHHAPVDEVEFAYQI